MYITLSKAFSKTKKGQINLNKLRAYIHTVYVALYSIFGKISKAISMATNCKFLDMLNLQYKPHQISAHLKTFTAILLSHDAVNLRIK